MELKPVYYRNKVIRNIYLLKNFSLITKNQQVTLSPAYDLLNTTIAQKNTKEELALPLNGKKNNLKRRDFVEYFAADKLKLNHSVITNVMERIYNAQPIWKHLWMIRSAYC